MLVIGNSVIGYEDYLSTKAERLKWRIAIPSYKRADILRDKTLAMLERHGVNMDIIDIFVANEQEEQEYRSKLKEGSYSRIIVGIKGMKNIRNFIQSFYDEGQMIASIDDDLKDLFKIDTNGNKAKVEDFQSMIDYCFRLCQETGARYWGIYAAANTFYMRRVVSLGLRYIMGGFWGMIVTHDKDTYVTMDDKEDFERSVRAYLKYGNVVRLDFVAALTVGYQGEGGMQEERTEKRVEESGKRLIAMFPQCVQRNMQRQRHFEVKLVEKREKWKPRARKVLKII